MQRLLKTGKRAFLKRTAAALGLILIVGLSGLLIQRMGQAASPPLRKESRQSQAPGSLTPTQKIPPGRNSGGGSHSSLRGGSCYGGCLGCLGGPSDEVIRTIHGKVKDANGYPLHGVKVTARVHEKASACKKGKGHGPGSKRDNGERTVYTDYRDGKFHNKVEGQFEIKEVLVGYNRYSQQGKFEKFEPASGYIQIVAQDISGNQFDKKGELDVKADTKELDGGLPQPIQLDDVTLENYYVVDDDLKIHLHKDLKDHRANGRSHEIRANHPLADSARYQDEVKAVTRKLASLGFRENDSAFLKEASTFDFPAQQAVKLFQTVWLHQGKSSEFSNAKGKVTQEILKALNEADGVVWTTNAPFDNGFTYATKNKKDKWIHATIPDKLTAIGTKSIITSASKPIGGPSPPHNSHRAGSEMDMRWITPAGKPASDQQAGFFYEPLHAPLAYYPYLGLLGGGELTPTLSEKEVPSASEEWTDDDRNRGKNPLLTEADAVAAGRTWKTRAEYSRAMTQTLIDEINALGPTVVLFNDPKITGVKPKKGHRNHIHCSFPFDRADIKPAGTDGAPIFGR
jgi:hypothetical protein